jgi:putative protease
MKRPWKKPELMSPAGYWPQLKAAIEAGADAVYFGLKQLWLDAGIRHFRLEFAHERAQQVRQVVGAFQHALAGERSFESLERELKHLAP